MDYSKLEIKQDMFGKALSYMDLKAFEVVENFVDTSHDTRSIVKDEEGRLYLYDFHEEMGFPSDEIIEHYFIIDNESQGKQFAVARMMDIKSNLKKYIGVGPGFAIKVVGA